MDAKGKGGKGAKGPKSDASAVKGPKGKGKGSSSSTTKPEISPTKAMKPLWWRRLLLGSDIKAAGSIWEKIEDATKCLPIEEFETRFSKTQPAKPCSQAAELETIPVIRVSNASHDRELRLLPPPKEVAESLMNLDDRCLALDELERLQQHVPASMKDLEALKSAMELQPHARLGRMEEYWLAVSQIPACAERMASWHFVRTYRERVRHHTEHLQDLSDMFSSLLNCEALPALLYSILSTGNWLNSGTVDGDAAAFDLKLLPELYEVKGADNSSLQHWIFSEFFDSVDSRAADFLEAFSPMLQNVSRKVLNDEAKVSKGVHLTLEECDEALSGLEAELCRVQDELQRCLEPLDATDPVKRRLQREFTTATASMAAVGQQRDALKVQFGELLKWLQMTETRSADFCLMWDNFLLPPDLLVARHQDAYKNNTFEELFCQGETFRVQEFQAIWELDRTYGTFGEEGDPPFQRQLSRSPAGSPAEASPSTSHLSQLQLIPLPWTKIEVSSGHSVWNAVQAQVASPIPQAELLPRFSAKAVAEAQEQRLAKEAKFQHEPSATQSQGEALPNVKDPETLKDPEEARSLQQEPHVVLTSFVASYSKTLEACSKPLEDLLDVAQCFLCSEVLPDFLALVLATGNYLNGGTARGQADGFDLSEMSKLQGIQDFDGKDLRHFIFEVFCRQMPCQAEQFFKDLRPCFQNVRKAISKDAMGTARLEKTVVHDLETLDEQVSQLQRDLAAAQEALSSMADHLEGEADNLEKAAVYVGEVVVLRDAAQAEFEKLFSFLSMKAMRTADFCLLWDNLFLPGDLMVNKGKDDYFIPAFCCQEPFQREHIEVLWGLHIPGEAEQSEQASMEGPLDAQQFCAALIPLVQSPEDFSNNATAFSACPGTRSNGGDLGEVERGQMHPAIEAVLFDPELELRVPLGPVETDAGYHLIMARKKCKGILSTTVSASHILVKHGRYKPPACEASIHLPNLVGEEGDVARTWRRWSFAHSLPPALSHLAEAQDEAEQLQQKRLALQGQPGLRLLFRWEGAFVFNIKGILSDISGDMVGPINLVDGSIDSDSRMKLGNLLTLDEARALNAEKDGFDGRLQWIETSWQDAAGILDSASMCTAEILLHRSDADGSHGRKTGPSVRLRVKPTKLAYAASEPGLRLGLSSSIKVQDRVATLVKQLETGEVLVKVDNGEEEIIDPRPRTVVAASSIARAPGIQILLLHDGEHLLHAEVEESARKQNLLRHIVVHNGTRQEFDLNEMNHSLQRFSSAQEFEEARMAYCRQIMEDGRYIEDAITGNRVDISEQIVRVEMQVRRQSDAETLRHMPFDDLEWVSDSSFRLGERVWAQGREGTIEHLQKHNRYMVKFSDGSSSPALHASSIKRAQAIAGVQDRSFAKVQDIAEIVPLLLHPCRLQGRLHGAHSSQPVLIRAGAGTGKTWSMQQLLFLLASELSRPEKDSKLRLVPLLIPIQKLARMRKANSEEGYPSNLVLFYIQAEFSDGRTRRLLEQAFEMRSLIVMLDGIDEAASMKLAVEDYVTKTLVPMGVPLLVTSRPEGIRKRLYSRDFVIMNLKPLGQDQQHKIIEKQLQKNNFFRHLLAFHGARREQEKTFKDSFSPQQVEQIEKALQATCGTAAPQSTHSPDHEVLTAVFFCIAVRLLSEAGLDANALQLPLELREGDAGNPKDMRRRLSLHSQKTGMIQSDFVCPSSESFVKVIKALTSDFQTHVDGEPAKLQAAGVASKFQNPGLLRLRYVSCKLYLVYQETSYPVQVQVHHCGCLAAFRHSAAQDDLAFLRNALRASSHSRPEEGTFDAMLEARMDVFEEICSIPVLLSVLACAFALEVQRLPADIYELYEMGMLTTLQRRLDQEQVATALEMLEMIAVANHKAKRRTFQVDDLQEVFQQKPQLLTLWSELLEDGHIPLVKILTLGHLTGEFQFSHLSFQEALFVRSLALGSDNHFWSDRLSLCCNLNDPFYRNALLIGRNHLAESLTAKQPHLNFDCQPRLSEVGRTGLRNLLAGVHTIAELDLANVNLRNDQEVHALVSSLTSAATGPNLRVLCLSRCQLTEKSTSAIGILLKSSRLSKLDLEGNTHFLTSTEAADGFADSIGSQGLQSLEFCSLRWCHIPPTVHPAIRRLFETCCVCKGLTLDLQGNRASRSSFDGFACLKGCL